jgi:acyl carrier protein
MTKTEIIEKIKDILLIQEEVDSDYPVKIDSLASLLLIQLYDENFSFRLSSETLGRIQKIGDLVDLVKEKLE